MIRYGLTLAGIFALSGLVNAQTQISYTGSNVTGQLVLTRTVNPMALGAARTLSVRTTQGVRSTVDDAPDPVFGIFDEVPRALKRLRPEPEVTADSLKAALAPRAALGLPTVAGLPLSDSAGFGFNGLTHLEQRSANNGNQFSTEPPNPSIAVANGYVLLGVNNAVQVYTTAGVPLLPRVLSSNELYGVSPAINRATGDNGVYPTDMRVFYDHSINRWFVIQRAQDYDIFGNIVGKSHLYMAVSQTGNPTGAYNIYVMETTDDVGNPVCPCMADYPMIGADQNGLYISSNQFNSFSETFVSAQVHAISKAGLATGATTPTIVRIKLPFTTGYEFAIHPAMTPAGASYFVANGGVQYFISTRNNSDNKMAMFALVNTASLATSTPSLTMIQILVNTLSYVMPDVATQKTGPIPYGTSVGGILSFIDGGDTRIQAAVYAGGRIYATIATAVNDETGRQVVGGAYVILSPTYRNGVFATSMVRQGYFSVRGNHLIRPAIGVTATGRGAIAATLVGPDHFPSSVYLPIETFSGPSAIYRTATGSAPQDGFTGYTGFGAGLARWGDYSTSFTASDGSIWMVVQYIPNLPRHPQANWGTFISKY